MVQRPHSLSKFVADKEGDSWYMCFLSFQKFMLCNERSQVKLDECNLHNQGFWDYPCYDEIEGILDHCGADLFEPLFELYRTRILGGRDKPQGHNRIRTQIDGYGTTSDRKVLHFWELSRNGYKNHYLYLNRIVTYFIITVCTMGFWGFGVLGFWGMLGYDGVGWGMLRYDGVGWGMMGYAG